MSTYRIDITIGGKGTAQGLFRSTGNEIAQLGKEASKSGDTIGKSINRGVTTASSGFGKLKSSASNVFGAIKAGATAAKESMGDLGTAITGLLGGYGALELAQSAWTGSTQKQFNSAYLATKMGESAAKDYIKTIQQIVSEVPGDDTYMNNLLTGAVAKQTNLSTQELKAMGIAAADYLATSQAMGKSAIETQMDLKEYLLTGNTSQLERDSILKQQMTTLKGQGTVSERILALNKALTDEGYAGLSQLDIASIKWETLKGKFQMAVTTIGEALLPTIERVIDFVTDLDEKTSGWSTLIGAVGIGIGLLALALTPVISATLAAYYAMKKYRVEAEKAALANGLNPGPGGVGGKGGKGAGGAGILGSLIPLGWTAVGTVVGGALGYASGYGGEKVKQETGSPLGMDLGSVVPGMSLVSGMGREAAGGEKMGLKDLLGLIPGFKPITDFWGAVFKRMGIDDVGKTLTDAFSDAKNRVTEIWNGLKEVAGIVLDPLKDLWGDLRPAFSDLWSAASEVGSALGELVGAVGDIFGAFMTIFEPAEDVGSALNDTSTTVEKNKSTLETLKDAAKWLADRIREARPAVQEFARWVRNAADKIREFRDKINEIKGKIQEMKQSVQDFANNVRSFVSKIRNFDLVAYIKSKIPKFNWKIPSAGDILGWIRSKIPFLNWKIPSVGQILDILWQKISGFKISGPSSAAVSVIRAAAHPVSAATSAVSSFVSWLNPFDGPAGPGGFTYEGYGGSRKSIMETIGGMSGNCVDGTLAQMSLASAFGIPSEMIMTTWKGNPHVYARIAGQDRDIANHALTGSWNAPPRGPSGPGGNTIVIQGDVYGFDDFKRKVEQANNRIVRGY